MAALVSSGSISAGPRFWRARRPGRERAPDGRAADVDDVTGASARRGGDRAGAARRSVGRRLGVPSRVDQRTGTVARRGEHPDPRLCFAAEMERRLGLPVGVETTRAPLRTPSSASARAGASNAPCAHARHGRRRRRRARGALYRAWAELGHMVIVEDGEPCQGNCRGAGTSRRTAPAGRRPACAVLGPGDRARSRRREHPALDEVGTTSASRSVRSSTSSGPSSSSSAAASACRFDLWCPPRDPPSCARRSLPAGSRSSSCSRARRASRDDRCRAGRVRSARWHAARGLRDPDRQPRRRHAARARGASRG